MGDVSPNVIKKTQNSLGKYVKKPALTEKLLKKPPFRFLHDVVKCVIKDTGFLNGLYTENELNSDNVKEKDDKIAFLTKLIDAVKSVTKTDLSVRPSKIVAGLEPEQTNILLQTIGKAIDKKIDTSEYVAKYKSGSLSKNDKNKTKKDEKTSKKPLKVTEKSKETKIKRESSMETPKSTDRRDISKDRANKTKDVKSREKLKVKETKSKDKVKEKVKEPKESKEKPSSSREIEISPHIRSAEPTIETEPEISKNITENEPKLTENISSEQKNIETIENEQNNDQKPPKIEETPPEPLRQRQNSALLIRPKSARPKSGDRNVLKPPQVEHTEKSDAPIELAPSISTNSMRPKSSLRPPSVRPSSARPGAPRLRPESALRLNEPVPMAGINVIVENFDGMNEDEETVVIQNTSENVADDEIDNQKNINDDDKTNKGQLVEQILEQMHESDTDIITKKKTEVDWEQDGLRGKDATTKEVSQLRNLIQNLTKTANPLGKLMNYLHEDMDAMHSELQMWTNTKKELFFEIEKQKKISAETSKPLLSQLEHSIQEIKKYEKEIIDVRSNILKNEERIKDLLKNK